MTFPERKPQECVIAAMSVLASAMLSGCDSGGGLSERESGGVSQQGEAVTTLSIFTWEDYFEPDALAQFEVSSGLKIEYHTFGDSDELEARLRSEPGKYDVVVVDDVTLSELAELKLLKKLDTTKLPLIKNLDTDFLDQAFDRKNKYSLPFLWGTWVIAYRKDKFEEAPDSWSILWDEKVKGNAMMLEESFDPILITLMMLGHSPNSEDPAHFAEATEAMTRQVTGNGVRYASDLGVREALQEGEVWAALSYNGDAARVMETNPNIDFTVPSEGTPVWVDNFTIPRDSQRGDQAHEFINFMMRPEIAAANANYAWFATPNKAAIPLLDEELAADDRIMLPLSLRRKCETIAKPGKERGAMISSAWHATRAALRERDGEAVANRESTDE